MAGVIAVRKRETHIALFFVCERYQKQGIGKRLFMMTAENNQCERMTVNSSPYAVTMYHKLGFCDTDTEQTVNGIRFTPMKWQRKNTI